MPDIDLTLNEGFSVGSAIATGFYTGGPQGALLLGGLAGASALLNTAAKPATQTAPRSRSPREAQSYPEPPPVPHCIGRTTQGGVIAYAHIGPSPARRLDLACVLSRGSLPDPGAYIYVWLNGIRTRFERQPAGTNPDGGTARWYEPATGGQSVFSGAWPADGVEVGDVRFALSGGEWTFFEATTSTGPNYGEQARLALSSPNNSADLHIGIAWPSTGVSAGDFRLHPDGPIYRAANDTGPSYGEEIAGDLFDALGDFYLYYDPPWRGRCRLYANFAADGTQGAELRANSAAAYQYTLTGQRIAIDEADQQAEWSTNHRLNGYSWIHFVCRGNTSQKLSGNTYDQVSEERRLNLSGVPSLSFELNGGREIDQASGGQGRSVHPADVAYWWLKSKGATDAQLGSFAAAAALPRFQATTGTPTRIIRKYEFRGTILSNQSTPELLSIIEFMMAGQFVFAQGQLHLRPLELAGGAVDVPADDILEYQLRPLVRTAYNRAYMQLSECPGAQIMGLDCALPIVQNNALRTADGVTLLERLRPASFIRDFYQGQWRLNLHAQQLAYRRQATVRVRATTARRALLVGARVDLTLPEGNIGGHLSQITDLLDGTLAWAINVGPALNFGVGAAGDYTGRFAPGAGLLLDDVTPPDDPEGVMVTGVPDGYAVSYTLPDEEDYDFTQIRDRLEGQAADDAEIFRDLTQGAFQRTGLTTGVQHHISIRHIDTSGNASVWSPEASVTIAAAVAPTTGLSFAMGDTVINVQVGENETIPASPQLPQATGGTAPYTYAAEGRPTWIAIDTNRRVTVSGTVSAMDGAFQKFTWVATDANGVQGQIDIDIGIEPARTTETAMLTFAQGGDTELSVQVGQTTTRPASPVLPEAGGGMAPYTYSTSGLPSWLAVDLTSREVTVMGTISELDGQLVSFDWIATDMAGVTGRTKILVNIEPANEVVVSFAQGDTELQVQVGENEINPASPQLPQATGGTTPYTYSTSGLPTWLAVDLTTRRVTVVGTVSELDGRLQVFDWIATDANSVVGQTQIIVNILPRTPLVFAQGNREIEVQVGQTATTPSLPQLPQAVGTQADITYTSPGKPSWLTIDANRRVTVTGTITEMDGRVVGFDWTATHTDGRVASERIIVNILPRDPLTFAQGNREIEVQVGVTTTNPAMPQLPQAVGTQADITYTSPGKPSWLTIDANRRVTVTGTVSELDGQLQAFDWVATHTDGRVASERIIVNILPRDPLTFAQGDREIEVQVGSTTTNPASPQLPQAIGTQSSITYTSPGKPSWLTIDSNRRVTITGTVSELDGQLQAFDWVATHTDGRTATERITVNILSVELPVFGAEQFVARFTKDEAGTYTFPEATISDGSTLIYTILPNVPSGLMFQGAARTIAGTPTLVNITPHVVRATVSGQPARYAERSLVVYVLSPEPNSPPPDDQ